MNPEKNDRKVQRAWSSVYALAFLDLSSAYLLFEGACLRIFCHYIVQCLNADVDDATELVLDHTNTQRTKVQ